MRIIVPPEIKELIEKQSPYLRYEGKTGYVLREDAPPDVVEARKKAQEWFRAHGR